MRKYYSPESIDTLILGRFPNIEQDCLQNVMRDAATLADMAVAEFAENGKYISNIRELADRFELAALAMLKNQFEK